MASSPSVATAMIRASRARPSMTLLISLSYTDERVATAWPEAGEARHRCFDRRSARLVGMAATGIEALLSQRQKNREPHRAASEALVSEIRRELRDVAGIVLA